MNPHQDELLKPSLATGTAGVPIYSAQAMFFTAFFGGPLAAVFLSALNSRRLARLPRDLPWYLLGALLGLGVMWVAFASPETFQLGAAGESSTDARRGARYVSRALALLLWAGYYWLHRPEYRAMTMMDVKPPSPWVPAIASIIAALAISVAVTLGLAFATGVTP